MSSTRCDSWIEPPRALRHAVTISGWLLLLAGFAMLLHLDVARVIRAVAVAVWLTDGGLVLARVARGHARIRRLCLQGRTVCDILDQDGKIVPCTVLEGSIVTREFAWLRLGLSGGDTHAEWLTAGTSTAAAWRRLQIVWRFGPAAGE